MTKQQLTQELQAEFKKGNLKPSQLKKSKSTGDLPATNAPINQPRRKSINPIINESSLKKHLEKAQDTIATLELKLEVQARELVELAELKKAQQKVKEQNEALLTQLAGVYEQLNEVKESGSEELDRALTARHQNLKD